MSAEDRFEKRKTVRLLKFIMILITFVNGACATVILNNKALDDVEETRKLRLTNPVCVNLNFRSLSRDNGGQFTYSDMSREASRRWVNGLAYYNIFTNCPQPQAQLSIDVEEDTKYNIPVAIYAILHVVSLGFLPFRHDQNETIYVSDEKGLIVQKQVSSKMFAWIFLYPRWNREQDKSLSEFGVRSAHSEDLRQIAILVQESLRTRGHIK